MTEPEQRDKATRRKVLRVGVDGALAAAALTVPALGFLRAPYPRVSPSASERTRIGEWSDFPAGAQRYVRQGRFFVFRDDEGLYAISAVCTHLGCIVRQSSEGFACPCHGSRFDPMGRVVKGPAPSDLPWWSVSREPSGRIVVDTAERVDLGTHLEREA